MPARPDPPQADSEDEGDDVEVCSDPPAPSLATVVAVSFTSRHCCH